MVQCHGACTSSGIAFTPLQNGGVAHHLPPWSAQLNGGGQDAALHDTHRKRHGPYPTAFTAFQGLREVQVAACNSHPSQRQLDRKNVQAMAWHKKNCALEDWVYKGKCSAIHGQKVFLANAIVTIALAGHICVKRASPCSSPRLLLAAGTGPPQRAPRKRPRSTRC